MVLQLIYSVFVIIMYKPKAYFVFIESDSGASRLSRFT